MTVLDLETEDEGMYGRMARTKLYDQFDIGIEGLLTSSFDDPNFDFDLFMENL